MGKTGTYGRGLCFLTAGWLAVATACSSATGGSGGNGGGNAGDGGLETGTLGAACNADGSCDQGLSCVGPGLVPSSTERYCAPPCQTNDDCAAFAQTSYSIGVPDTFTPIGGSSTSTTWHSTTLSRGVLCASPAAGAAKVCMFGCPEFSALGPDSMGNLTECFCLPGYSLDASKSACQFGTTHQCSIFSYGTDAQRQALHDKYGIQSQKTQCSACNSNTSFTDTLGCHSDEFFCNLDTSSLDGDCVEGLSTAQFQQCVAQKTNFTCNCDASCAASCVDEDACYGCCTCTNTSSPLPAPTCTGDGGTSEGGAVDSGGSTDSGGSGDGGASDTGSTQDTGAAQDSGAAVDSGAPVDSGTAVDTGGAAIDTGAAPG